MRIHETIKDLYKQGYRLVYWNEKICFKDPTGIEMSYYVENHESVIEHSQYDKRYTDILLTEDKKAEGFTSPSCQVTAVLALQMRTFSSTVEGFLLDVEKVPYGSYVVEAFKKYLSKVTKPEVMEEYLNSPVGLATVLLIRKICTLAFDKNELADHLINRFIVYYDRLPIVAKYITITR